MAAATGNRLALLARERTGKGQKVEIGMLDVMASLLTYQAGLYWNGGGRPTRRGNQHPSIVPYEVFQAKDAYLTLGVANNSLWGRACRAIGREDLIHDPRFDTEANRVTNRAVLIPILNETFGARPAGEWLARLEEHGVPAGRIKTVPEVCESPHLKERGMVVSLPHPKAGSVTVMGVPIRLGQTPGAAVLPPPLLGEHTDEILTRLLRLPRARATRSARRGVLIIDGASTDPSSPPRIVAPASRRSNGGTPTAPGGIRQMGPVVGAHHPLRGRPARVGSDIEHARSRRPRAQTPAVPMERSGANRLGGLWPRRLRRCPRFPARVEAAGVTGCGSKRRELW